MNRSRRFIDPVHSLLLVTGLIFLAVVCGTPGNAAESDAPGQLSPAGGSSFSCGVPHDEQHASTRWTQSAAVATPSAIGEKRILLYRVDFSDAVGAAISSNAAATLISDLNNFYRDMSYGLMSFALSEAGSTVTETLRLPEPSTAYDNNFPKFINAVRQVATNSGYALENFDFDIVCTGAKPGAFFGGIAFNGGPGVWVPNNNFNAGVAGHELGHNLGLPHASFWYTADQSTIGPGVRQEYGDIFDSMGAGLGTTNHFNARFKNFLGWIPDADAPFVSTNGTYRITAHDNTAASGRRAVRIARNSLQNYWVEFRQGFYNNRFVTNGITVRWAGNDATNTLLLDTTPGTPSFTQDSPVLIGRTFSDHCLDLHVTPVGKAGTMPESVDLVINRGPFVSNVAPIVTVMASATTVTTNTVVSLQAVASDANGDALAYLWDFGDGNFGGNQANVDYTWTRDGEYVARCTVTDMKGGTASDSVLVRAGTVSTFLVEGRVLRNGAPVEGALIKAGSRLTYTDSDGTYRLSRLSAGRQTLLGVLEGFGVINAGFENPIPVGPNASGLDFAVLPDDLNSVTLVATGSVWKYLDTGVAPASDWTAVLYDDSGWSNGRARLGYGVGGEGTIVSYGTNANNRHITTWFRQRFVVEDAAAIDHLVFRLRRDDGAVVYLNGTELYRENLPQGEIQASTTAQADITSGEEQTFFKRRLPPNGLTAGTNVVAVEIHQVRTNSIDLSFDLELLALTEETQSLRPRLMTERSATDMAISWPASFTGWFLYNAGEVTSGNWLQFTAPVLLSNNWNTVRVLPTNAAGFYRLRKPTFCAP